MIDLRSPFTPGARHERLHPVEGAFLLDPLGGACREKFHVEFFSLNEGASVLDTVDVEQVFSTWLM